AATFKSRWVSTPAVTGRVRSRVVIAIHPSLPSLWSRGGTRRTKCAAPVRSPCVTMAVRRTPSPARATEAWCRQTVRRTADRQPILESDQKHQANLNVLPPAKRVVDQRVDQT